MCVHAHTNTHIYIRIHALWIGSWLTMPWDCQSIQFWFNWCRVKPSRPWCINSWPSASASVRILLGSVENAFKVLDDALPWMALMRPWMSRFQRWKLVHQVRGNRQQQPARLFEDSYGQPILLGWVHCDEIRGLPLPLRLRPSNRGGLCVHKKTLLGKLWETHRAGEASHSAPEVVGLQLVRWVGLLWCISWSFPFHKTSFHTSMGWSSKLWRKPPSVTSLDLSDETNSWMDHQLLVWVI